MSFFSYKNTFSKMATVLLTCIHLGLCDGICIRLLGIFLQPCKRTWMPIPIFFDINLTMHFKKVLSLIISDFNFVMVHLDYILHKHLMWLWYSFMQWLTANDSWMTFCKTALFLGFIDFEFLLMQICHFHGLEFCYFCLKNWKYWFVMFFKVW